MDLYKIIKREPEKKSCLEKFGKAMLVIGAVAAVGVLVLAFYKKWKECQAIKADADDFDDEWFCDCDEYVVNDADSEGFEPECVCCPDESQAEVEYEEKEDKDI